MKCNSLLRSISVFTARNATTAVAFQFRARRPLLHRQPLHLSKDDDGSSIIRRLKDKVASKVFDIDPNGKVSLSGPKETGQELNPQKEMTDDVAREFMCAPSGDGSLRPDESYAADEKIPNFFAGMPSTPGFKKGEFDSLSTWAVTTTSNRPVVAEYEPDSLWLWSRWEGTLKQMTWRTTLFVMAWALAVNLYAYHHYTTITPGAAENVAWYSYEIRRQGDDAFFDFLQSLSVFWEYNLTLVIFTLSFFVNQAYEYWKRVYFCARAQQGRINDLTMLVTAGAVRSSEYGKMDGATGYSMGGNDDGEAPDSKKLVTDVTRMLRMSHAFFWAATPTSSDGLAKDNDFLPEDYDASQIGPRLLSRKGLETLVKYNQLTQREMDALIDTKLSPSQYPYVLLEWAMLRSMGALRTGELVGGAGLEDNLLRQFTQLRAEYFNIGDYAAGRMSMAYMVAIELITDSLIFLGPLALYPKMGPYSIIASGLVVVSLKGLLELSKSFLDTFGNEGFKAHNIRVDVLVSEANFGASQRWVMAGDMLPSEVRAEANEKREDGRRSLE